MQSQSSQATTASPTSLEQEDIVIADVDQTRGVANADGFLPVHKRETFR